MNSVLTPEYLAILRRMTGQQKWRAAFALYWSARKLKAVAIRLKHPDWSEDHVREKVKQLFLHART